MDSYTNNIGVQVPRVLLPKEALDYSKWAVVACDQHTSELSYWEQADATACEHPSTLRLILPEAYLGRPGEAERIEAIKASMKEYLSGNVFRELPEGFVFVRRSVGGKERLGLILALDLEQYDYSKGASTLIRATEGTIVDRIPPRLRIREGSPLELPHILVLIDDPNRTVIEPLAARTADMALLYDTELMLNGGHISGHLVSAPSLIQGVLDALSNLTDAEAFAAKYGPGHAPLLFAMGDGNHSFATAKAAWENIKTNLPESQRADHPARYALVEIENVHDTGIVFEPIHRVLFGVEPKKALSRLTALLHAENGSAVISCEEGPEPKEAISAGGDVHVLPFFYKDGCGIIRVSSPSQQLAVGTLQSAIDAYLKEQPECEVDYIHGGNVTRELSQRPDAIGFLLPVMEKSELFPTVVYDGALPRKTFSMGEPNEKRYYMECRRILAEE